MPLSPLVRLIFWVEQERDKERTAWPLDQKWQEKKSRIFQWRDRIWCAANPQFFHDTGALTAGSATMRLPLNVGQCATTDELFQFWQLQSNRDGTQPPLLVIDSDSIAVQTPTLIAGMTSVFYCNLVATSLVSGQYILDDLRLPDFNARRVFVERPFPAHVPRRFEYLGEYKVDVISGGQHVWEQLPAQSKQAILAQYTPAHMMSLAAQGSPDSSGIGFVGSMVRPCYDQGYFIPEIVLRPMPPTYFVTLPLLIDA
ncbi:hypothetical protein C8R46DRAFT_1257866 [Mycena filopes]|nr:hypothetical protein C8R46DRAFT_1257866 [Mycena filopes]